MAWTAELEERLRTLWRNPDLPASRIAAILGCGKGAVTGKVRRMGLEFRRVVSVPTKLKANTPALVEADVDPVHITNSTSRHCRFPMWADNDSDLFGYICGRKVQGQTYYCKGHTKIMYKEKQNGRKR